jgi:iron complex outermembrane receptor protein
MASEIFGTAALFWVLIPIGLVGGALLGGAINIITPNGKTMPENGVLRLEGGDYGTARAHASVGGQWGGWAALLTDTSTGVIN